MRLKKNEQNVAFSGTYNHLVIELYATLYQGGKYGSGLVRSIASSFVTMAAILSG